MGNSVATEMVPFSKTEKLFLGQGTKQGHALHLGKVCILVSRREGRQSRELVAIPSEASEVILGMVFFGHGIRRKWGQILFKTCPVPFARFLFCDFHFPVWCILRGAIPQLLHRELEGFRYRREIKGRVRGERRRIAVWDSLQWRFQIRWGNRAGVRHLGPE